ncbi:MAG TPA: acyltransferase domain-containing protein [Acidimicrobiales bacterium]
MSAEVEAMRTFWPTPSAEALERVADFEDGELAQVLDAMGLKGEHISEIVAHWRSVQDSASWASLLAAGLTVVARDRGNVDAALPIWPDLDEEGDVGRLFYFYLFALCFSDTLIFWRSNCVPENVIDSTINVLVQHTATHLRKLGTLGVDAGWWMLLVLRGELLSIGSLEFHHVNLGVGTLAPEWYSTDDPLVRTPGFRRGDSSMGIHIPQGADLSPAAVDRTLREARAVIARVWPGATRRLATCRSWMMEDRLAGALAPDSNLVLFLERFTLVPGWVNGDEDVVDFVFRLPHTPLEELPQNTTLERFVVALLRSGEHFHVRTGWFDFDGVSP